jgi:hypothetical protein
MTISGHADPARTPSGTGTVAAWALRGPMLRTRRAAVASMHAALAAAMTTTATTTVTTTALTISRPDATGRVRRICWRFALLVLTLLSLSSTSYLSFSPTYATTTPGLVAWGDNGDGELGNGTAPRGLRRVDDRTPSRRA